MSPSSFITCVYSRQSPAAARPTVEGARRGGAREPVAHDRPAARRHSKTSRNGTSGSSRRRISSVSSSEPSSTTIQRAGGSSCAATARTTRSMCAASLRTGETIRMRGLHARINAHGRLRLALGHAASSQRRTRRRTRAATARASAASRSAWRRRRPGGVAIQQPLDGRRLEVSALERAPGRAGCRAPSPAGRSAASSTAAPRSPASGGRGCRTAATGAAPRGGSTSSRRRGP